MESMVKSPPVTEIVMPTFIMDPTEDEVYVQYIFKDICMG